MLFETPSCEKKAILFYQETFELSPFWADLKLRCFKLVVFWMFAIIHSTGLRNDLATVAFSQRNFFRQKKFQPFLVIRLLESGEMNARRRFGEGPRNFYNTIHAFDITDTGISNTRRCEKNFNAAEG